MYTAIDIVIVSPYFPSYMLVFLFQHKIEADWVEIGQFQLHTQRPLSEDFTSRCYWLYVAQTPDGSHFVYSEKSEA
mgnify:CR=1 FL=1